MYKTAVNCALEAPGRQDGRAGTSLQAGDIPRCAYS